MLLIKHAVISFLTKPELRIKHSQYGHYAKMFRMKSPINLNYSLVTENSYIIYFLLDTRHRVDGRF